METTPIYTYKRVNPVIRGVKVKRQCPACGRVAEVIIAEVGLEEHWYCLTCKRTTKYTVR